VTIQRLQSTFGSSLSEIRWLMAPGAPEVPAVIDVMVRPAWMAQAECVGEPHETFFPRKGAGYRQARMLCGACPVGVECLEYAMADPELVGWWGGTTDVERKGMRDGQVA
jgi:WhiB family redox-sensing transcriptional regulator